MTHECERGVAGSARNCYAKDPGFDPDRTEFSNARRKTFSINHRY